MSVRTPSPLFRPGTAVVLRSPPGDLPSQLAVGSEPDLFLSQPPPIAGPIFRLGTFWGLCLMAGGRGRDPAGRIHHLSQVLSSGERPGVRGRAATLLGLMALENPKLEGRIRKILLEARDLEKDPAVAEHIGETIVLLEPQRKPAAESLPKEKEEKRRRKKAVPIDEGLMFSSFQEAVKICLSESHDPGRPLRPKRVAQTACRLYCDQLPAESPRPGLAPFQRRVISTMEDPAIASLLKGVGVTRRELAETDRSLVRRAYKEALRGHAGEIRQAIERKGYFHPRRLARLAHDWYCRQLPEGVRCPSPSTIRSFVIGRGADPEILKLIRAAGILPPVKLTGQRAAVRDAFRKALFVLGPEIKRASAEGGSVFITRVTDKAFEIFVRGIPKGSPRPKRVSFNHFVKGNRKDPVILEMIEEAGVRSRKKRPAAIPSAP